MRRVGIALSITALLAVAACSSSTSTSSTPETDPTFGPSVPASSAAATSASPAPAFTAAASTAPAGAADLPGVPAVTGATDLTKQPGVAKGTGPAPTLLVTRDLIVGTGAEVKATSTVGIRYVGTLYTDGTVFDTSWTQPAASGAPAGTATFPLSGVVPGFGQGLVGMKIGGRRELVIPPALGYGAQGSGPIPANSTIVFVVDMLATT